MKLQPRFRAALLLMLCIFGSVSLVAQVSKKAPDYSKHPYWITMMDDPKANYFETVRAFDEFWASRSLPHEEDEIIGQSRDAEGKGNLLARWFRSKEERREEESKAYAFQVKKYRHWKLTVAPYVQPDGSILGAEERLKIWREQRN